MAKVNQGGGEDDYSQPWQKKKKEKQVQIRTTTIKKILGCKSSCIIRFTGNGLRDHEQRQKCFHMISA